PEVAGRAAEDGDGGQTGQPVFLGHLQEPVVRLRLPGRPQWGRQSMATWEATPAAKASAGRRWRSAPMAAPAATWLVTSMRGRLSPADGPVPAPPRHCRTLCL